MRHSEPPGWLEAIAWVSLGIAFAIALAIAFDIVVRGHRQKMAIMNVVYPVTALYWGPVALWFYLRYGRRMSKLEMEREPHESDREGESDSGEEGPPKWWQVSKGVTHCGAGCTLGDIGAEWLVYATGWTLFGAALYADYVLDFAFAWTLGIVFQYFAIVPMRDLGPLAGLWAAVKADTLSIVAFQLGLFAGMAVYQLAIFDPPLDKATASYWFLMQLSMVLGFFTAYPVNAWLIRIGWKERM